MQVIEISEPLDLQKIPNENVVLAMGFFDGVHRGHQAVIQRAKEIAAQRHLKLAIMTFDRFPKIYFRNIDPQTVKYVTPLKQRLKLFEQQGIKIAYVARFDETMAKLSPQYFVDHFMADLHAKVVVAGFDYTYGKPDVANMKTLPQFAQGRFDVVTVDRQALNAEKIGTTQIKTALDQGKIEKVNQLLGYRFSFPGKVVHGEARGRELGFPTLNIQPADDQWIPGIGVYAVRVKVDDQWYQGMCSVSHNETFGNNPLTIEINLFDFNRMIYGQEVEVEWDQYLRAPVKFESVDQLIVQLKQDKIDTQEYFAKDFK
ncbi:riboflavin biosynthesis protein RibF [Ligilactobacillus aviarius]|uniref:Riboflavin biosynthesis protein n=1 Tax=Ligilactobacillus aviarius TaxID=1606 RepID=A0A179C629_9LACO|nr:riboflavin biosynthesis protein RibF [Ligilactobacillus aviarius]OAP97411.1 bifunctional riboflavin kinase/FMN adenylyltransferase [Ligilactobacillus aviarius]OAQ00918.1 bifunctional riboflavin kinase/FMN adenylyltransferase [Ligilactobacillus aviarius]OAQ01183.1 bifunctional riboflavin kinase/FMN adenylyltransferase [Ligilactobacillus aviarius]OAQ06063.1 bifunctional riboflavin kinase/FMN adenylyltransferase [Ligilactobacillus aviarius]OAQ08718.1 bifunctional riboflavin kinase/FMN adenylyl